jgi:hypothetical protein
MHPSNNRCTHPLKFDCRCTLQMGQTTHIYYWRTTPNWRKRWNKVLTYITHLSATRGRRLIKHANPQKTLHVDYPVPRQTTRERRRQNHNARHQDGPAVPTLQIISTPHAASCTATHRRNTAIFRAVAIRCPSTTGCMRVGDCARSSSRSTRLPRSARKLSGQEPRLRPSHSTVLPLLGWLQLSTAWVCHERMTCLKSPKQPRSNSLPLKYASHTSHRSYPHLRLQASDPISYSTR